MLRSSTKSPSAQVEGVCVSQQSWVLVQNASGGVAQKTEHRASRAPVIVSTGRAGFVLGSPRLHHVTKSLLLSTARTLACFKSYRRPLVRMLLRVFNLLIGPSQPNLAQYPVSSYQTQPNDIPSADRQSLCSRTWICGTAVESIGI